MTGHPTSESHREDPPTMSWWRRYASRHRPHKILYERFNPANPYLYRWLLFRAPFGLLSVFLHRIVRPDDDPDPHDHPWLFWIVRILEGGYWEHVDPRPGEVGFSQYWVPLNDIRDCGSWAFHGKHLHRIDSLLEEESWSLVIAGPKVREWGFVDRLTGCWTRWQAYIRGERC